MAKTRNNSNGHPIPNVIEAEGRKCIQFEVPDDPGYIAAALGAITNLTHWYVWEKGGIGDRRATETATYFRGVLEQTLNVSDDCAEGQMPDYSMELEGCNIVLKADGIIVSTIDLTDPDLSACLPEGPMGPAGPQGPAGEPGEPGSDPVEEGGDDIPAPPLPPGTDSRCGIAYAVAGAVRDVYYLPMLEEYILQTVTNGQSHLDFMRYLQTQFGFIGLAFSYMPGLLAWVNAMEALYDVDIYNDTNTTSFLDAIACELFCTMVDLEVNEITAEVRTTWIDRVWNITTEDARAIQGFAKYLEAFELVGMRTEALYAAAAAPGQCDDCGCVEFCVNESIAWTAVTTGREGWSSPATFPAGVTNPNNFPDQAVIAGLNYGQATRAGNNTNWSSTVSNGSRTTLVKRIFTDPCLVERAGFTIDVNNTNLKIMFILFELTTGEIRAVAYVRRSAPALSFQTFEWTGDPVEVKGVYFVVNGGRSGGSSIVLQTRHWINDGPPA